MPDAHDEPTDERNEPEDEHAIDELAAAAAEELAGGSENEEVVDKAVDEIFDPAGGEQGDPQELAASFEKVMSEIEDEAEQVELEEKTDTPPPAAADETAPEAAAAEDTDTAGTPDDDAMLKRIIEGMLFVTEEPLKPRYIARLIRGVDTKGVRSIIRQLKGDYETQARAFEVVEIANGFRILTKEDLAPWLVKLRKKKLERRLSQAALETLAIIAYKQPLIRAEIENIRGVGCGPLIRSLLEKRIIRITGRSKELGSPLLYGTTPEFLNYFGLGSLEDLPQMEEMTSS